MKHFVELFSVPIHLAKVDFVRVPVTEIASKRLCITESDKWRKKYRQQVDSRETAIGTEYVEASLFSAVCPFSSSMMVSAIHRIKRFKLCREGRGLNCRVSAKAAGNTKQIALSFHSQIAEQAHYQVYFILVSDYTVRGMIIMDRDGDDDGNNKIMTYL